MANAGDTTDPQLTRDEGEEPDGQPAGGANVLKFNEQLSWKAGKAPPVATLIKRLTALSKELSELEQEDVDRDSLATPAKDLVAVGLLQHKDDGVKAYTACCLADMLRLHAPDAPYTANQLKDIFQLFVKQLKKLSNPDSPYYPQYTYLLDSLSSVKSVVLISDIPDSEGITLDLFTSFFDIAKPDGSKNVEYHMTDILIQLIDECNSLPSEVVDIIIAQFLRAVPPSQLQPGKKGKNAHDGNRISEDRQTKLTSAVPPPAYMMAKTICNSCVDKMARHICQYFSDVMIDAAGGGRHKMEEDDKGDEKPVEIAREDLADLIKAHVLAKELWKSCPMVLQNVIPQLEQELLAESSELRELSTDTIGEMALTGSFSSTAPATWKVWVGRANDKSSGVRANWVEAAVKIIRERNDHMAVQLVNLVANKLNDLDEKVRLLACRALRALDYESIITKLGADQSPFNTYDSASNEMPVVRKGKGAESETRNWGKKILANLGERARDKKIQVRLEGMRCLARMWDMAYKDIAAGNESVIKTVGWIPSKILDTFYINDTEVNVLLDHVLHEILIPVNYPPIEKEKFGNTDVDKPNGKGKGKDKDGEKEREKEVLEGDKIRVQRLLVLVKGLDQKAKRALFAVPLRQISYGKVMEVYLKACEDWNSGVIEEGVDEAAVKNTLDKFSGWLAMKLPDQQKAKDNLHRFAKLHDRRCYQLIRYCYSPESDYRTVVRALKEIKKRIGDSSIPGILDSLTPLLYRVSQLIYNKSHVAPIVEFSRSDELGLGGTAHEVLKEMSQSNPAVFKANVKALSDLLQEQSPENQSNGGDATGAVDTLKACAEFAKSYPNDMPQERKLLQSLVSFALTGKPPAAAKHAVTILMYSANHREMYASDLIKRCVKDFSFGEEHFLAKLACLAQLVLLAPDQCEEEAEQITEIARDILLQTRETEEPWSEFTEDGKKNKRPEPPQWCEDTELSDEIKAKLLSMRILVNRLRTHTDQQSVENIASQTMRMLLKAIVNEGELSSTNDTPSVHRSRIRLAAAQMFLKLAVHKPYDDLIGAMDFNRIACVAQDPCFQVRKGFIDKLKKYLAAGKIPPRFYTIIFLMGHEPTDDWREEVVTWVRARTTQLSKVGGNVIETIFARLLSLLAHHPDFKTQVKDFGDFAKYIIFYLKAVGNEDNLSLIYYVAQRIKQFRDRLSPNNSDNIYYLSELAQAVIRRYAEIKNWTIETWPGKLRLPASLFQPMTSAEESQAVTRKTYLPEGVNEDVQAMLKRPPQRGARKRKSMGEVELQTGAARTIKREKTETPAKKRAVKPKTPKSEKKTPGRKKKAPKEGDDNPKERRRSGRQHKEVKYTEENDEDSDEDEDMVDVDSDEESESDAEPAPKGRRGRPRKKRDSEEDDGEGEKQGDEGEKDDGASAEPEEAQAEKETSGDAMDVDAPANAEEAANPAEAEAEEAPAPEAEAEEKDADDAAEANGTPSKTPRGRGRPRGGTRRGRGKAAAAAPTPSRSTRATRSKAAEETPKKGDGNSSELSDVPDE